MRPWLILALLVAPVLAGCLGNDDPERRLAQPTTEPIVVPTQRAPTPPSAYYNFSDPGYKVDGRWRAGDGWDYESNQSNYRRVRVIDTRLVSGTLYYVLEEKTGKVGQGVAKTTTSWVNGKEWALLNTTDNTGIRDTYTPGVLLRYHRNGSFGYEHVRTETSGRVSANETVGVQTRLHPFHQTILLPWGYVEAKRVEHVQSVRGVRGTNTTIHWVHADYMNDVQYQLPSGETYKLTAAKAGDFRRGTLVN